MSSISVMSALGHKQTFAVHKAMSALPPKADIQCREQHVRFVPIADIETNLVCQLFDHVISLCEH